MLNSYFRLRGQLSDDVKADVFEKCEIVETVDSVGYQTEIGKVSSLFLEEYLAAFLLNSFKDRVGRMPKTIVMACPGTYASYSY